MSDDNYDGCARLNETDNIHRMPATMSYHLMIRSPLSL